MKKDNVFEVLANIVCRHKNCSDCPADKLCKMVDIIALAEDGYIKELTEKYGKHGNEVK